MAERDVEQIVGRERRERVSHHDWSGDACLNSRRRVNSTVRRLLLTMKNTPNQSRIITGVAWYRPEQWQRLREVSEDVENLEETYDAWLQTAERMIRDGIPADVVVEKIDVDVEEVLAWCNVMGLPMNTASRARFESERVRQKHETS